LADHLAANKAKDIDLIFIGDSITEAWYWGYGLPVWKKYYAGRAIDFGVSADKTQHVLWRLDHLGVDKFHPKVAVILIGTNNWDQDYTPEDIEAGVKAVIAKTQATFPGVKILLMSILPNARANDKMAAANPLLKNLADGKKVIFVDLASKFTPEGDNWKGLLKDKLHLTTEGYEMWAAEINPLIDQLAPKAK
jgi:lysophospholipase L1-like esterase